MIVPWLTILIFNTDTSLPISYNIILLDKDYNTKLCDFGLAKDASVGHEMHTTTKMVGSKGYEAPEYIMTG